MKVPGRQSAAIGVLMNTRGLTELVILNVGKQLGVLDDELFTMLVLMALITTAMTGPLLKRVYSDRVMQRDIAAAERAALGVIDSYRVLVLVDDQQRARSMAAVGAALLGTGRPAELVLSRLVIAPEGAAGGGCGSGARPRPDGDDGRRVELAGGRTVRPRGCLFRADQVLLRSLVRCRRPGRSGRGGRGAGRPGVRRPATRRIATAEGPAVHPRHRLARCARHRRRRWRSG